jgi:hypothetical protein
MKPKEAIMLTQAEIEKLNREVTSFICPTPG